MNKFYTTALALLVCTLLMQSGFGASLRYEVTGISSPLLENVKSRLDISKKRLLHHLHKKSVMKFYSIAEDEIKNALAPFGYFRPTIKKTIRERRNNWELSYDIHPGPRMTIDGIDTKVTGPGKNNSAYRNLIKNFPVKVGQPINMEKYKEAKSELTDTSENLGYLNAHLTKHKFYINRDNYTSFIKLYLDTGPQFYFGNITMNEVPLDKSFVDKFITMKQGAKYSSYTLLDTHDALISSTYFDSVIVTPKIKEAIDFRVPVDIKLTPKKSQAYSIGAGYATDSGAEGRLGVEWRRLTRTGHKLRTTIQGSKNENGLTAEYIIPGGKPLTDQYKFSVSALQLRTSSGLSRTAKLTVSHIKSFKIWQRNVALSLQHERVNVSNQPFRVDNLLMPSVTFVRRKADDLIYPSEGKRFSITTRGGVEGVISRTSFLQTLISGKYVTTLGTRNRIILKADAGAVATNNVNFIPFSLQFYLGGPQNIRGYSYRTIGTGRYFATAGIDYQFLLVGDWGISFLADAGEVFSKCPNPPGGSSTNFSCPNKLRTSVGVGIFRKSPIGPIQIAIAKSYQKNAPLFRIIFNIGPDL